MRLKKIRCYRAATLALTIFLVPTMGMAQESDGQSSTSEEVTTYEPAYFSKYQPRTALDMVGRIPGFQLQFGENKRGLGQGGANVLINGERISGKLNPREQLNRILASNVVRIEILDGTALDIPGLSGQVANIITKNTGTSGTWNWNPEFRNLRKPRLLTAEITASGERGNLSWSGELKNQQRRNGHRGPEYVTDAAGVLFEKRDEDGQYYSDVPSIAADFTWKPKPDHIGNLNLKYTQFNFDLKEESLYQAITPRGEDGYSIFTRTENEWNSQVGADYEFPFWFGKLKLIAYNYFEHSPVTNQFKAYDLTSQTSGSEFHRIADEGETILRTEYSWSPESDGDWQLGGEIAYNFLDIADELIELDDTGQFVPVDLDEPKTKVEEQRAELTLTHSRPITPKWDMQTSIGVEFSEITQENSTTAISREFTRPKGFVSVTYKPSDSLKIRGKLEREVGQLSFFDFISSVSLRDNINNTGNPDLVPSQSWIGEVELDKNFGTGNNFKARLYGKQITDLVDRIPVGVDGDAVGNIDEAQQYGVDFSATLKEDIIHIKGGELELGWDIRDSSVKDPLLGFDRRLNGDKKSWWSVQFRQDIPDTDYAWGFWTDQETRAKVYRLTTVNNFELQRPFTGVFIEHKDIAGIKARATLMNLLDSRDAFRREYYDGRRDIGSLDFIETNARSFDPILNFNFSGTF
ncbi:MAG: TonB-dependent receptor plug domain-containing protein [bacterium]